MVFFLFFEITVFVSVAVHYQTSRTFIMHQEALYSIILHSLASIMLLLKIGKALISWAPLENLVTFLGLYNNIKVMIANDG